MALDTAFVAAVLEGIEGTLGVTVQVPESILLDRIRRMI